MSASPAPVAAAPAPKTPAHTPGTAHAAPGPYQSRHKIRIVTAASLFDGHDAAINIMRRIIQSSGAEVIHLGHNRSVAEVVDAAIQEDAQAIAMTSYQGGHVEYLKYMKDLLRERGAGHIRIFGGGGGTILPSEIAELHAYGIDRIFSPDDGRAMGLQGMINYLLEKSDYATVDHLNGEMKRLSERNALHLGRLITVLENHGEAEGLALLTEVAQQNGIDLNEKIKGPKRTPILGITGTGGAGKSSITDELVRRFIADFPEKTVAVLSVDPSKRKTGGALLGDRIRMNAIHHPRVYMRSFATREANLSLNRHIGQAIQLMQLAGFDLVIVETAGIGQSDSQITEYADVTLYVMTPEYGAATQLEKIDMLDYADVVALNKFDKRGALDALRDVRKQVQRNTQAWDKKVDDMPVFGSIASQFNDPGTNRLYRAVMDRIVEKTEAPLQSNMSTEQALSEKVYIIPPERTRYLAEIAESIDRYDAWAEQQTTLARQLQQLRATQQLVSELSTLPALQAKIEQIEGDLAGDVRRLLAGWAAKQKSYSDPEHVYTVRGKAITVPNYVESLAGTQIPKVALPKFEDHGEIVRWSLQENVPGEYPYTAGVFPFKRTGEDPTRMFAGEGEPERTNRRFHYLSLGMPAARLSTAFDSVTLYGENPATRPDIYGKIGNSGVSIASLDDAKKLYSGFDLSAPTTSVSMTINGPAPMLLAFFLNAAIDQQAERYISENGLWDEIEAKVNAIYAAKKATCPSYHGELPEGNTGLGLRLLGVSADQVLPADVYEQIKAQTLQVVRGTVQADILKEDQAQNTCIFSTEFALRMMGDIQAYFTEKKVRNFYSVSISGYHIAEAGANPITQLAFTLSNGFTFVEYYLSRGLKIDDFAPNLSFFFSNGMDPEYSVIGRVARRIWAKAIKHKYGGAERSQMLKYHIQTSGRSLHAQEIAFNDIRTTLQALYAIYDNCNSLHTNAYDEAITTPTEESVRRAVAIQLIINRELGLAYNENPMQGSFIIEELTDLVEQAVLTEFRRITERGGVLGAMETMYQRGKIQEESMHYEMLKHDGTLPIIGVNTYLSSEGSPTMQPKEVIRSGEEEKHRQIGAIAAQEARNSTEATAALARLQHAAVTHGNVFAELMEAAKVCTLGQMTQALYAVGGQYRRNM
jgi:methylmalonyl-CoA mutase